MNLDDLETEIVLWEINREPFTVFNALGTQWRIGMNGATGLDYNVLPAVMDLLDVSVESRKQVFQDLRVMEQEALSAMADNRDG